MNSIVTKYFVMLLLLGACASHSNLSREPQTPPPFEPLVSMRVTNNSTVFSFNITAGPANKSRHEFIGTIDSIRVAALNGENIDKEFTMNPPQVSGIPTKDRSANVMLNSIYVYKTTKPEVFKNSTIRYTIFTQKGIYIYDKQSSEIIINNIDLEALTLTPYFEKTGSDTYSIGVTAARNYSVEEEYIPSSQTLIVRIQSENGMIEWDSSEGKNFLQMIESVLPTDSNQSHKYELVWNGRDRNGNPLKPGKYTIHYTIPAKPNPYFSKLDIQW